MLILVFVTEDANGAPTDPALFLKADAGASLPRHPRGLEWRYFATVAEEDGLLAGDPVDVRNTLHESGFYIANRIV